MDIDLTVFPLFAFVQPILKNFHSLRRIIESLGDGLTQDILIGLAVVYLRFNTGSFPTRLEPVFRHH